MEAIGRLEGTRSASSKGWQTVKVAPGARTLELSPAGDFIFVACNFGSMVCVVDSSMRKVAEIEADSYPVGLDVSPDGRWLITTSQGRKLKGGHCIDVFSLTGLALPKKGTIDSIRAVEAPAALSTSLSFRETPLRWIASQWIAIALFSAAILLLSLFLLRRRRSRR